MYSTLIRRQWHYYSVCNTIYPCKHPSVLHIKSSQHEAHRSIMVIRTRTIGDADPEPKFHDTRKTLTNHYHSLDMSLKFCGAKKGVGISGVLPSMQSTNKRNYIHVAPSINSVRMAMEFHGKPDHKDHGNRPRNHLWISGPSRNSPSTPNTTN